MIRRLVLGVVIVLVATGCSGGSDSDVKGTPATSTASSRSTTASPSSPTPPASLRTAPVAGASSVVRFRLLNQRANARAPEVVALKRFMVGLTESMRRRKLTAGFRAVTSRAYQKAYSSRLAEATQVGRTVPPDPIGRLERVTTKKQRSTVIYCLWPASVAFYSEETGKLDDKLDKTWFEMRAAFRKQGGRWVLQSAVPSGDLCTAPPP